MTSPKLAKALDGLFEGTISIVDQSSDERPQPTWMEVVACAKANPDMFSLITAPDGLRSCRFTIRHFLCAINENDWRLIMSGAVDRFGIVSVHGTPEDEAAELVTVEILEERLQAIILNTDKVAEKARQLKYRLGGRKAGIKSRQRGLQQPERSGLVTLSHHPGYNLRGDLLGQFLTPSRSTVSTSTVAASRSPQGSETHDDSLPIHLLHELMYSRVDSLPKGALISPRCDLCRKRKKDCVKNATACEDCTKKHSRCTWLGITTDEASGLLQSARDARTAGAVGSSRPDGGSSSISGRGTPPAPLGLGPQA